MKKLGPKGSRNLKIIHICCIAIWFGGVMSWLPLVWLADLSDFEQTKTTYYNLRSIAWNVIGWGGISSLATGLLLGTLTRWQLFKHRWVTVKFFVVICLILFGMFFLEARMLTNLDLLIENGVSAMSDPQFLNIHRQIQAGLVLEAMVFISLIAISVIKPHFKQTFYR
jgi:uncharacterized membrane protein